jgi:2-succinyl-5-enolpyruvyl-6-hydroxy-3-cyclohexene-1-carboxylate synthase
VSARELAFYALGVAVGGLCMLACRRPAPVLVLMTSGAGESPAPAAVEESGA